MGTGRNVRKILVAIKELRATPLLDKAAHIALARGAELVMFHDLATPVFIDGLAPGVGPRTALRSGRQSALARLETLAAPWRARGLKVSTAAEWDFPPHEAIVREALRADADLIVVQGRGRHHFPALLGYTDWSLLRDSPIPVLLVKNPRPYLRPRVLAAVDPVHSYSKPSDLDSIILREAESLARSFGTAPHVMHSYMRPPALGLQDVAAIVIETIDKQVRRDARKAFGELLHGTSVAPSRRHLVEANPVDAIIRTQREIGAAIVVMGAVSRRGLKRVFIGNTAERLLDELTCDLLVVKPAKFATGIARSRRGANLVTVSAFAA